MPSAFRSPKTLSGWIELDYFHRRRLFRGWRGWLVGALVVSLVGLGAMVAASGYRAFQAGPLSPPHALFSNDCSQCHQDRGMTLLRVFHGQSVGSVPDSACLKCHAGEPHNPPHGRMGRCVSCHTEHRGHQALIRVDDRLCTRCHADLQRPDGTSSPFARSVTSFTRGGHPDFHRKEADPGTLKFNHAVHLAETGVLTIDRKQLEKQLEELRTRGIDPDTQRRPVKLQKLDCADCHRMDAEGHRMQPISFEKHCQQCHALGVQIVGGWQDAGLKEKVWQFGRQPIRHPSRDEKPDSVWGSLRERLSRFIAQPGGDAFLTLENPPPARIDRSPVPEVEQRKEKEYAWVDRYLRQTGEVLFNGQGGCGYCHTVRRPAGVKTLTAPDLEPTHVPARWWDHADFKHDTHRMLQCGECHPAKTSRKASDVLLPDITTCIKCHNSTATASARADCVQCHVYHDPQRKKDARERGKMRIDMIVGE
jgi:hypothetical protein